MTSRNRPLTAADVGLVHGFRSGLEENLQAQLDRLGVPFSYEDFKIPWVLHKNCTYTPDFLLPNGIIVESKGRFVTSDRQKHLMVKAQWPGLDIRFVFSRSSSPISKASKTTYAKWCETKGFLYADKLIPQAWLDEPVNEDSLSRVRELFSKSNKGKQCPF